MCPPGSPPTPHPQVSAVGEEPGRALAPRSAGCVLQAAAEQLLPTGRHLPGAPNPGAQGWNGGPRPDTWTPGVSLFGNLAFAEALKSQISEGIALRVGQVGLKANDKALTEKGGRRHGRTPHRHGDRPQRCFHKSRMPPAAGARGRAHLPQKVREPPADFRPPELRTRLCCNDQACGRCAAQRAVHGAVGSHSMRRLLSSHPPGTFQKGSPSFQRMLCEHGLPWWPRW